MKKNFYIFLLTVVLIASLFLFWPVSRREVKSFMTKILSRTTLFLKNAGDGTVQAFSFVEKISNLKHQNEELAQKLIDLQVDKSAISELETENQLLKEELGFLDESSAKTLIPAKIIEREPTTFMDYITLDKGTSDGVLSGQAVISNNVLVGQINQAMEHTSIVTLITSKDSIVQAMLQDSRAKGIMRGGISGLYLDNITQDTDYKIGEFIVTSGLGGKIKQGILIGKADKLQSSTSGIFKTISIEPIIDLSKLELVFVQK